MGNYSASGRGVQCLLDLDCASLAESFRPGQGFVGQRDIQAGNCLFEQGQKFFASFGGVAFQVGKLFAFGLRVVENRNNTEIYRLDNFLGLAVALLFHLANDRCKDADAVFAFLDGAFQALPCVKTGYAGSVWRLAPNKNLVTKAVTIKTANCVEPCLVSRGLLGCVGLGAKGGD